MLLSTAMSAQNASKFATLLRAVTRSSLDTTRSVIATSRNCQEVRDPGVAPPRCLRRRLVHPAAAIEPGRRVLGELGVLAGALGRGTHRAAHNLLRVGAVSYSTAESFLGCGLVSLFWKLLGELFEEITAVRIIP